MNAPLTPTSKWSEPETHFTYCLHGTNIPPHISFTRCSRVTLQTILIKQITQGQCLSLNDFQNLSNFLKSENLYGSDTALMVSSCTDICLISMQYETKILVHNRGTSLCNKKLVLLTS